MSASHSESESQTTTSTQDRRLTTGAGDVVGLTDVTLNGDGSLNITSSDAAVVQAALENGRQVSVGALSAAQNLTQASNSIAAQVADSQRSFVETASGQKTAVWISIAGIVATILIARKGIK